MKNLKHLLFLSIGSALVLSGCNKHNNDNNNTPLPEGTYPSLAAAYAEVAPKTKTSSFNATTGGSFYGNSGTRYVFPANAFQNAAGVLVSGAINVEVLECLTESDMIFGKMLTVSNGTPLLSAGEARVSASQSGEAIYIRPGKRYEVRMPNKKSPSTNSMELFTGAATSSVLGSMVNWNLRKSDSATATVVYDGDTIIMVPDSVGFVNLDKYPANSFANVTVKIAGIGVALKQNDFFAYYVLDAALSASPIYSAKTAFVDNEYKDVKILNMNAHYIVCAVYNGDFYGGILENKIAMDGATYTITVSKTSPKVFKTLIDALK